MDDVYLDQAEIAAPVFIKHDCPLTFFVITGMLDQNIWPWDARISWIIENANRSVIRSSSVRSLGLEFKNDASQRTIRRSIQASLKNVNADSIPDMIERLADDAEVAVPAEAPACYQAMSWQQAQQLERQGVRFAPHSVSHNIFSRLDEDSMEQEIGQAWQTLQQKLDTPLKVFCYPTGREKDFSQREIDVLKQHDYLGAVSATPELVRYDNITTDRIFSLPRLALPDNMTDFIQYCSWIECARAARHETVN
jgi:peptidoglycan/xylan/chitin deacetylase (PgdA/CDA1 family)